MSNLNAIIELLKKEKYNHGIVCGPGHAYVQHGNQQFVSNSTAPDYVVPDYGYHPEVKVVIDFSHQFVLKINTTGEEAQGERLVSQELLKNITKDLASFLVYYFDYVTSYKGSNKDTVNFINLVSKIRNMSNEETEILPMINEIINFFITKISINRNRNEIGTATIIFRDNPRIFGGKKVTLFFNKLMSVYTQLFVPMLPVQIWARGRIYKDFYFPIFDGIITSLSPSNTQGFTEFSINCRDVLELARISSEMINPSLIQTPEMKNQPNVINIFSKALYNIDHMSIFRTMIYGGKQIVTSDGQRVLLNLQNAPKEGENISFTGLGNFGYLDENTSSTSLENYVESRVIPKSLYSTRMLLNMVSYKNNPRYAVAWGANITPYRVWNTQAPPIYTSEFSSRLDILRDVSRMTYYELYVDGSGTIQYHPMRTANNFFYYDIISLGEGSRKLMHKEMFPGVQVLSPEEVVNTNSILNVEELITFMVLNGIDSYLKDTEPKLLELVGSAMATSKMKTFGYRRREVKNELFNFNAQFKNTKGQLIKFLDLAAIVLLQYANSELYTRTSKIVFRPEIDIAKPVYFTDDDTVFYVNSISHEITIGADASTTINGSFGRSFNERPVDLMNFITANEKLRKFNGELKLNAEDQAKVIEQLQEFYKSVENNYTIPVEYEKSEEENNEYKKMARDLAFESPPKSGGIS